MGSISRRTFLSHSVATAVALGTTSRICGANEAVGVAVVGVNGMTRQVTGSFGVAASIPGEINPEALIERADEALYLAKRSGRNCFRVAAATRLPTARNDATLARAIAGLRRPEP